MSSEEAMRLGWLDRELVKDTLYRYASTIDVMDHPALRETLADDARVRYGTRDWIEGADAAVAWIADHSRDVGWQHHLLNVYHVDVDGDVASALTYHTSHVVKTSDPDRAAVIVARYHDRLRREAGGWKITEKWMEIGWRESRAGVSTL